MSSLSENPYFNARNVAVLDIAADPAIDSLDVAPLRHLAYAVLGESEFFAVLPEQDAPEPSLQTYSVVALSSLGKRLKREKHETLAEDVQLLNEIAASTIDGRQYPPDVLPLRTGENLTIGQRYLAHLGLSASVDDIHLEIAATEQGLTFRHLACGYPSKLVVNRSDLRREIPRTLTEPTVSSEVRDEVYGAFSSLLDEEGQFGYKDKSLRIAILTDGDKKDSTPPLHIYIMNARDYINLDPTSGYLHRHITVDPEVEGIEVFDKQSNPHGIISKIPRHSQATVYQANHLLAIADQLTYEQDLKAAA
ncbi:MAG: hypothetical protein ACHQT9_00205 [Candidatus Saccharimonadales bacterium]